MGTVRGTRVRKVVLVDENGDVIGSSNPLTTSSSGQFALQLDDTGVGGITYIGEADTGTATSAAAWRVKRMTETGEDISIEWADGDSSMDNIWDNRAALSYS